MVNGYDGQSEWAKTPALRKRVLPLRGPITEYTFGYFINRMINLGVEGPKEPILMEIDSLGGVVPQSLQILRLMDHVACPVSTFCRGTAMGTAAVLAAHGVKGCRAALPTCRFSLWVQPPPAKANEPAGTAQRLPQEAVDQLLRDAGKGEAQLLNWIETGAEFTAQQALEAGIIDSVSTTPPPPFIAGHGSSPASGSSW